MSGFVDEAQIHVKAGDGGAGSVSFRREAHVAKGGPDGGNGGKGGDVWLVADRNVASLLAFKDSPHREATKGKHGMGRNRTGESGKDIEVPVPEGTVVKSRNGEVLADLATTGARWKAANGGRGGKGNAAFLSNRRRAPGFAEQGEVGEEFYFNMELRLMADVAVVGFPNAGKSTLISRISAAKPKIADYPFTTLEPNLGVVRFDEHEFTVADIPGLIEGASEGKGLGLKFLKHVERARVLVVLVDLASAELAPRNQIEVLLRELESYDLALGQRQRLVVGSRSDFAPDDVDWSEPRISAVTGENLRWLQAEMAKLVDEARKYEPVEESYVVFRPLAEGVTIEQTGDGSFVVHSRDAERAVALSDLTNEEAMRHAQKQLIRLGVYKRLARAGARSGDVVHIGKMSFDYEPD